ncbi:MAG: hypothetical protein Q8M16_04165 [Pirellulaceae bacterium]|nr:hypothetical protein [Pirellulaceae bacterium]
MLSCPARKMLSVPAEFPHVGVCPQEIPKTLCVPADRPPLTVPCPHFGAVGDCQLPVPADFPQVVF